MRNVGAERNYKNDGRKNHWRRWLWNEILSRTRGREKTELVLYFPGSQDLDRPIAISKGVPGRNLIAIDRHLANVLRVRSASNYALYGDVVAILGSWPADVPVCAIVLDFNGGLMASEYMGALCNLAMMHRAFINAAVAVNLQRGRDAVANQVSAESERIIHLMRSGGVPFAHAISSKHRGFAFALFYAAVACLDQAALAHCCSEVGENLKRMAPKFYTYRSRRLVFDTAVMNPLHACLNYHPGLVETVMRARYPKEQQVVRKIAATLATRTRQYERRA